MGILGIGVSRKIGLPAMYLVMIDAICFCCRGEQWSSMVIINGYLKRNLKKK